MFGHFILGTVLSIPEPEPLLATLGQAGYTEARVSEVRRSGQRDVAFALHYARGRAPMFVECDELTSERDVNTSQWEMVEELVSDPDVLRSLRCFIEVRHYQNADPAAVRAVLDFLGAESGGILTTGRQADRAEEA